MPWYKSTFATAARRNPNQQPVVILGSRYMQQVEEGSQVDGVIHRHPSSLSDDVGSVKSVAENASNKRRWMPRFKMSGLTGKTKGGVSSSGSTVASEGDDIDTNTIDRKAHTRRPSTFVNVAHTVKGLIKAGQQRTSSAEDPSGSGSGSGSGKMGSPAAGSSDAAAAVDNSGITTATTTATSVGEGTTAQDSDVTVEEPSTTTTVTDYIDTYDPPIPYIYYTILILMYICMHLGGWIDS